MPRAAQLALAELLLLLAVGCQDARRQRTPGARASASLASWLAPRASSRFSFENGVWRQAYPRLPSSGEWRCAERSGTVWCVGGEPAAGIVAGTGEAGFSCGPRWGSHSPFVHERVCIDRDPEYPDDAAMRRCSFEQEQGIARVCKSGSEESSPRLAQNVVAACWVDVDCFSRRCDRGACSCLNDSHCEHGTCQDGYCRGAKR
ncbi:MAG TPA: hypothetical protein VHB79_26365 [Polyangiaceae bacterium]|nr:hypothetical protein [Polyangiaceae bacterium]